MSKEKIKAWRKIQKNGAWKGLTDSLSKSQRVYSRFNNFIKDSYWKFREKKGISKKSYPEVKFLGFGGFEIDKGRLGYCESDKRGEKGKIPSEIKSKIFLNKLYLLDKLGMSKLVYDSQSSTTDASFNALIETIAHELAHAYQETVNQFEWNKERSQCKSSGDEFLFPELVAEHTKLTGEIEQMIINSSEYQKFKNWWDDRDDRDDRDDKICKICSEQTHTRLNYCPKCIYKEEKEINHLFSLLSEKNSPNLTTLEENWQTVKDHRLYKEILENEDNDKEELNKTYNNTKKTLQSKNREKENTTQGENNTDLYLAIVVGGILTLVAIIILLVSNKKRKSR